MAWACGIRSTSDGMYKAGDVPILGFKSWNDIHFAIPQPYEIEILGQWESPARGLVKLSWPKTFQEAC